MADAIQKRMLPLNGRHPFLVCRLWPEPYIMAQVISKLPASSGTIQMIFLLVKAVVCCVMISSSSAAMVLSAVCLR